MHGTIVNDEISAMDLSKVAALQQKRTLAFVNHFVMTTVQFLNNFMKRCDQKLMNFERKLEKVEASMVLLEARLSSIPEINTTDAESKVQGGTVETTSAEVTSVNPTTSEDPPADTEIQKPNEDSQETSEEVSIPPEYMRFVKMVQVGVPLQAVKLKAGSEGLDTELLEKILSK